MPDQNRILDFLKVIDKDFPIPISDKVNLDFYAAKLYRKARLCTIESDDRILALVAGYIDNLENNIAYIALAAVLPEARGNGYATKLIFQFLHICREKSIAGVHLYTHITNEAALHMYRKIGFVRYDIINEPRPQDIHLIYWIER